MSRTDDHALYEEPSLAIRGSGQYVGTNAKLSPPSTWITARDSITSARVDGLVQRARSELSDYLRFHIGWDGYDGRTFNESTIKTAKKALHSIQKFFKDEDILPNEITPGPLNDGSVDLEISYNKKCLFLTFHPDEKVSIYTEGPHAADEKEVLLEELGVEAQLIWLVS